MSVKISMAMSEENELPERESFIAHCTLEFDDDSSIPQDSETLQHKIHSAIAVCCRAVHEELQKQRPVHHTAARPSRSVNSIQGEP